MIISESPLLEQDSLKMLKILKSLGLNFQEWVSTSFYKSDLKCLFQKFIGNLGNLPPKDSKA
jgi:hypothetical protein